VWKLRELARIPAGCGGKDEQVYRPGKNAWAKLNPEKERSPLRFNVGIGVCCVSGVPRRDAVGFFRGSEFNLQAV
jgi:hypothetical protein